MLVANRFEVQHEAGSGGMGVVYRALDRETGEHVALKLLRSDGGDGVARFLREQSALAALSHPAIVRHVAHGALDDGRPWMAMEWLEGEDLARRLRRGPLAPALAVEVVRTAAVALSVAHARSFVHRDIKPGNIFLVGGETSNVRVLDFGIARHRGGEHTPTLTGEMLGTPGYLAPEQARGDPDVDERADFFSLGCVLFECLTGQPAFSGAHVMAVLAKILLDDQRRVSDVVQDVPPALDALVTRMLSRDKAARPLDATALIADLDALGPLAIDAVLRPPAPRAGISQAERRRVVLALFTPLDRGARDEVVAAVLPRDVRALAKDADVRVEELSDGAFAVLLSGLESATDLAARAAHIALALRARFVRMAVHITTSTARLDSDDPVGDVVERAVLAANRLEHVPDGCPIYVDAAVVALLGDRFDVRPGDRGHELWGTREAIARSDAAVTRKLARSPCLGRERELSAAIAVYDAAARESAPAVCLVTGPAGVGKSRLRMELTARLEEHASKPLVWTAVSDPMEAGAALATAARLLRRAVGALDHESPAVARSKLDACLLDRPGELDAKHLEILAEIAFGPAAEPSPWLQALRAEPAALRDQIARAFLAFLDAHAAQAPLVVILDDVQWADAASTKLLGVALQELAERAFVLLGFARPEATAPLSRSWADGGLQEIRLGPLSRKAAEEIAAHVMGARASPAAVKAAVAKAGGNAFLVEQIAANAVREGASDPDDLPDSVVAVLQAHLEGLTADARRVLRAASVLGERFWLDAISALLGGVTSSALEAWIHELEAKRLVERSELGDTRFTGQIELRFMHALVREAVLATMTSEDRVLAHALAGAWLESAGERDPLVLARHFELGELGRRAAVRYAAAADRALASEDLAGAASHAERALSLGLANDVCAHTWLTLAEARSWLGDNVGWQRAAEAAATHAELDTDAWWLAGRHIVTIAGRRRDRVTLAAWWRRLIDAPIAASHIAVRALAAAACAHFGIDAIDEATRLLARAESLELDATAQPIAHAELCIARGYGLRAAGEARSARAAFLEAAQALDHAGDVPQACRARIQAASVATELDALTDAIAELGAIVEHAGQRLPRLRWAARTLLADALRRTGNRVGADEQARLAIAEAESAGEDIGALAARATATLLEMERRRDE